MTFFGDIQVLIQGGCVGIALMLLVFGYRLGSQIVTLASNHLAHIAESLGEMNAKMDIIVNTSLIAGPRGRKGAKGAKGDPSGPSSG